MNVAARFESAKKSFHKTAESTRKGAARFAHKVARKWGGLTDEEKAEVIQTAFVLLCVSISIASNIAAGRAGYKESQAFRKLH